MKNKTISKINNCEMIVMYDVDDTLLLWDEPDKKGKGRVEMLYVGEKKYLTPHTKHIELLKHWSQRGFSIYVWSGHGFDWATEAVTKLGLEEYVHHIMTKPCKYVDDLMAEQVLGSRVYLPVEK